MSNEKILREALEGLVDIGRKDTSNPKYDWFYTAAKAALATTAQFKENKPLLDLLVWYQGKGDEYRESTLLVDVIEDFKNLNLKQ